MRPRITQHRQRPQDFRIALSGASLDPHLRLRGHAAPQHSSEDAAMQYTTLGRTGLKVSVAGLGCGGNSRIGQGTGLERGAVDRAGARGARPRRQLPRHRQRLRHRGHRRQGDQGPPARQRRHLHQEPRHLRRRRCCANLDNSLKQLDTDYVDIFHLHGLGPARYDEAMAEIVPAAAAREGEGQAAPPRRVRDGPARPRAHHAARAPWRSRAGRCSCWASA